MMMMGDGDLSALCAADARGAGGADGGASLEVFEELFEEFFQEVQLRVFRV